jgi:hypothetical protein
MYTITDYSKKQVAKFGVELRLSSNPKKKLIFKKKGLKM